jgi:hypothetical protein
LLEIPDVKEPDAEPFTADVSPAAVERVEPLADTRPPIDFDGQLVATMRVDRSEPRLHDHHPRVETVARPVPRVVCRIEPDDEPGSEQLLQVKAVVHEMS